jgi:hypothetical protein
LAAIGKLLAHSLPLRRPSLIFNIMAIVHKTASIADYALPIGSNLALSALISDDYDMDGKTARLRVVGSRKAFEISTEDDDATLIIDGQRIQTNSAPNDVATIGQPNTFLAVQKLGVCGWAIDIYDGDELDFRIQGQIEFFDSAGPIPGIFGDFPEIEVSVTPGDALPVTVQVSAVSDYVLPAPTTTTLGGVKRNTGTSGQFVTGIDTDGSLLRATPAGAGSGTVTSVAVSGSDGIEVDSGSPITTSGTIALGINASTLKTHIALNNVENTAISTFAGSANITTIGTISTGTVPVANVSGLGTAATTDASAYAPALGVDDNYVTDAEKTVIGNTSGTNTGDQDLSGYVLTSAIDTLAEINGIITDATLIDTNDTRLSDSRTPTSHSSSHVTGGADKLRDATASQDGLMTSAYASKLDGVATGANLYVHPNHSGDVTSAGDGATTIANNAVTFAKIQTISGTTLVGRHGSGTGNTQEVSVGNGVEFSGSGIRRAALTGDVTASAGSNSTTIANDAVTNAKLANMAEGTLKGRASSGAGDPEDITIGSGLTLTGTTLSASGGSGGGDALTSGTLDQFTDVTQTATKTLAITESTTLAGGTHSGTNTGDQDLSGYVLTESINTLSELNAVVTDATLIDTNDARLSDARTPTSHTHGNLTNGGAIGTTSGLPIKTGTSGVLESGAFGTSAGEFAEGNHTHSLTGSLGIVIDGAGSAVTTGLKGFLRIPYACVINSVDIVADQTGSAVIDIWADSYANFPPAVGDSIVASAKPTLSSAQKSQNATLTGWTTSLSEGSYLAFNVDSAATVTRITLTLKVTRTI